MKTLYALVLSLLIGPLCLAQGTNSIFPAQTFSSTGQTGTALQLNRAGNPSTIGSNFSVGTVTVAGLSITTVTFAVMGSSDNGVTYYALPISTVASPGSSPSLTVTATAAGIYQVNLVGITHIEIVTSGTFTGKLVTFTLTASPLGVLSHTNSGGGGGTWSVQTYGAAGNGTTNDAPAANAARAACEAGGGGTIMFPPSAKGYVIRQQTAYGNDVPSILMKSTRGGPSCNWDFGGNQIILRADAAFAGTLPYPPNAYVDSPYDQEPVVAPFAQGATTFTLASTTGWNVGDRVWWGYGVIPNQTPLGLEPYYFGYANVTAISGTNVTIDQPGPAAPNTAFVTNGLYKVTMTSTGSGYLGTDTCSFTDGGSGSGATCALVVTAGAVNAYISATGAGYTAPALQIVTSTGSGAAATITTATGYIVAGINGTWRVSQNATITDVQGYVYQNARIDNANFVTDISNGGDAEEGIICTFCDNVIFENISCTTAAGAGCVYPHYSANLTVIGTKIYSSQEQDGNRAKGRCIGIAKANNTVFLNTDCNNFETGAFTVEDPNTNVYLNNFNINDTSPNHCHGNGCPNSYIGGAGRITIENLNVTGNGNVQLFGDLTGTSIPEFKNVSLNTLAPLIIYPPILQHMTGFLNIQNDVGTVTGNLTGFYPPPRTYKSSCTAIAGGTTNCGPLPSGIYRSILLAGDLYTSAAQFVRIFSGWNDNNLVTPTAPVGVATSGGSLPAGTVCAVLSAFDSSSNPTAPSPENCVTVNGTSQTAISWSWIALTNAATYKLFVGTTGAESSYFGTTSPTYMQTVSTGTAGTPAPTPAQSGVNYASALTPGVVLSAGVSGPTSYDAAFYLPSINYKNQGRNREFQIINSGNANATTVTFQIDYWPLPTSDGTDLNVVGDAANLAQSNTYVPGNKQSFQGGQNGTGSYVAPVNIGPMGSDTTSAVAGDIWFNSSTNLLKLYSGSATRYFAFADNLSLLGTSAAWNNSGSAIAANSCISGPQVTMTGLTNQMGINVSPNVLFALGLTQYGYFFSANTAQIVVCNVTASPITVATPHSFTVIATPAPL